MSLLALILFSCEEPSEIGLELKSDSDKIGVFYQELELPAYVINLDSLLTSSSARLLSGNYRHQDFGNISASSFTQFGFGSAVLKIAEGAEYDSLILSLDLDYTFGPGVEEPQKFTIHELQEDLIDTAAYFSFDRADYDPEPVAAGNFLVTSFHDSTLYFRINDNFGERFFNDVKDSTIVDPNDEKSLEKLYKGFALIPDAGNNSIFRFNQQGDNSAMNLYYHIAGDTVAKKYDFRFYDAANFNRIVPDWTGTPLQGVADQHNKEFTPSDNKIYLEAGAGLITKIDLSPVKHYFDSIPHVNFNSVVLEIKVNPLHDNELPPSSIQLFYANSANKRIRNGNDYLGLKSDLTGDVARPSYNDSLNTYTAQVTISTDILVHTETEEDQVLVFPPEFGLSLSFNHFQIEPGNIKLKMYYTKIK